MISIKNLEKNYKGFKLNISMEIPAGVVTGIIGRNGTGKSTTIKSILGLVKKDGGDITLLGKDIRDITPADKEKIGVALSDSGFCEELNIKDVNKILKKTFHEYDEQFFMGQIAKQKLPTDKKIKEFSTGMKAKLRVLVAISHNADLLILDEPTSGLDVIARNEVLEMLRAFMEEKPDRSILISSHISTDLEGICDDIYFLNEGKVILHEDTDAILGQYGVLKLSDEEFENLDKQYIVSHKKEKFGYICLTKEKSFYLENYPGIVIENGNIDDMIVLMLA